MQRVSEYKLNAAICAAQASAVPEPFKAFYEALELQWRCVAAQTEREFVRGGRRLEGILSWRGQSEILCNANPI
jgi:hypothetical protein